MKTVLARSFHLLLLTLILGTGVPTFGQRLTPPPPLNDVLTENQIGDGTRNLVICIHGWNPPGLLGEFLTPHKTDKYAQEEEWTGLISSLRPVLQAANTSDPWALLLYHWEEDAATGLLDFNPATVFTAYLNATEAADNASAHGRSLGPRLPIRPGCNHAMGPDGFIFLEMRSAIPLSSVSWIWELFFQINP